MSKKPKYLEQVQRDLVKSIYYVDERYTKTLKPQLSDWFKKMKPLPGFSRLFQDYNKRYFTLNLSDLSLYYAQKEKYSINEISYIPFEDVIEIIDKPHYALSNQGIEWKEAFGFTIYMHGKYIILVAQSNKIYLLWLNYFEAIRFKINGRSILNRTRTPYYSNLFILQVDNQLLDCKPSIEVKIEVPTELNNNSEQNSNKSQNSSRNIDLPKTIHQLSDQQEKQEIIQQELEQKQQEYMEKDQEIHQKYYEQEDNICENQNQFQIQNQDDRCQFQEIKIVSKQVPIKECKQLSPQRIQKVVVFESAKENQEDQDGVIQIIGEKQEQQNSERDNQLLEFQRPIRLDDRRKKKNKQNSQDQQIEKPENTNLKKNITNIWRNYDWEGNELQIPEVKQSNYVSGLFLQISDIDKEDNNIEQPDFLIRFDELDSARQFEHN